MLQSSKSKSFESFLGFAKFFYISIGMEPFERAYGWTHSYLLDLVFAINIVNLNYVFVAEIIYVLQAMYYGNNFLKATMNLSYIGFVFVGDIKIWSIRFQKSKLTKLIDDLREIFPHSKEQRMSLQIKKFVDFVETSNGVKQMEYDVYKFFWRFHLTGVPFAIIHLILIWTYNLMPVMSLLFFNHPRALPYYVWVPWDWENHWSYPLLYASQNLAGHTCMMGQLGSDLLLCAVLTQVIMHYKYLAVRITTFVAGLDEGKKENGTGSYENDMEFLKSIIEYHQRVLSLSDAMNGVFGVSLLMNFMSSAFIMCFLGFQMTIGVNSTVLVMLMLFIFCSLVQVYLLTNYGQELILASENVGHAVYNHNWFKADVRYRKMLVLIIKRAQKPAILKATFFLNVSLGTMTDLLQLSYKFFALLRTMYSK